MHNGDPKPVRTTRPTAGTDPAVNVEQTQKPPTSRNEQATPRKKSTRAWALRRAVGPSWGEKIEQF